MELALVVVSELVTNSIRHASAPADVTDTAYGRRFKTTLYGSKYAIGGPGAPSPAERLSPPVVEIGGYGLELVATIATRWGVERDEYGTQVWAQLPV